MKPQSESLHASLREEIDFWRDFARWWETRHGPPLDPRILEALHDAEARLRQLAPASPVRLAYSRHES